MRLARCGTVQPTTASVATVVLAVLCLLFAGLNSNRDLDRSRKSSKGASAATLSSRSEAMPASANASARSRPLPLLPGRNREHQSPAIGPLPAASGQHHSGERRPLPLERRSRASGSRRASSSPAPSRSRSDLLIQSSALRFSEIGLLDKADCGPVATDGTAPVPQHRPELDHGHRAAFDPGGPEQVALAAANRRPSGNAVTRPTRPDIQ